MLELLLEISSPVRTTALCNCRAERLMKCAQGDSNSHGGNPPQGPQPCASTQSRPRRVDGAEYRPAPAVRQDALQSSDTPATVTNTCSIQPLRTTRTGVPDGRPEPAKR